MSNLSTKRRVRTMNLNSVIKIFDQSNELIRAVNFELLNELITLRNTASETLGNLKTLDDEISILFEDVNELQLNDEAVTQFMLNFKREIMKTKTSSKKFD